MPMYRPLLFGFFTDQNVAPLLKENRAETQLQLSSIEELNVEQNLCELQLSSKRVLCDV